MTIWTRFNFQEAVDPVILARGREYFSHGPVSMLERQSQGWAAMVEGSQSYAVEMIEDENGALSWYCCRPGCGFYLWGARPHPPL